MNEAKLMSVHPGEMLLEEFLKPMNISQNQMVLALRVPARRINEIIHGKRRITADTALRLARYFNMSPRFWLGVQMDYNLDVTEDEVGAQLNKEVVVLVREEGQNLPMQHFLIKACPASACSGHPLHSDYN
jgi:antitoxin HigA-1